MHGGSRADETREICNNNKKEVGNTKHLIWRVKTDLEDLNDALPWNEFYWFCGRKDWVYIEWFN
jgi:hypothetical protein